MATKKKAKKTKKAAPKRKASAKKAPKAAVVKAQPMERFEYGENQEILRTSAKKFLADNFSTEKVRALTTTEAGYEPRQWQDMGNLGWHGLLIPEELGGIGLSLFELGVLLEEMGYHVAPTPYLAAQLSILVLNEAASAAQKKKLYPRIAEGTLVPTLALEERGYGWDVAPGGAKAKKQGKSYVLNGTKINVTDAQNANCLLVTANTNKGPCLFAVDPKAKGVKITPNKLIDETRSSATGKWSNVKVDADALIGREGGAAQAIEAALPRIWSAVSAEMVGTARRVFQIAVEYAKVREQFGRPIGSFQGVKHRLVDRMTELENARSNVYGALWAQDHDRSRALFTAHVAKACLSETGPKVADTAVRTHGGIGFTWECDVHLFWKRLHWGQMAYGDGPYHRKAIAEMVIAAA